MFYLPKQPYLSADSWYPKIGFRDYLKPEFRTGFRSSEMIPNHLLQLWHLKNWNFFKFQIYISGIKKVNWLMPLQKLLICMGNFPMLVEKLFMKLSKLFVARMLHLSSSPMEMFILAGKDPMEDLVMDILMMLALFKSLQVCNNCNIVAIIAILLQ